MNSNGDEINEKKEHNELTFHNGRTDYSIFDPYTNSIVYNNNQYDANVDIFNNITGTTYTTISDNHNETIPSWLSHEYNLQYNNINKNINSCDMPSTYVQTDRTHSGFKLNTILDTRNQDVSIGNATRLIHDRTSTVINNNQNHRLIEENSDLDQIIDDTNNNNTNNNQNQTNNSTKNNSCKPRVCSNCGKSFKYPSDLKKHLLIHDGVREYKCDKCSKSFRREHQLIVHTRIHTGEKPFTCQYCGANFRHDSTYAMHIRTKHDNIKPFFCELCHKAFGRLSHLRKHQKLVCNIRISSISPNGTNNLIQNCSDSFNKDRNSISFSIDNYDISLGGNILKPQSTPQISSSDTMHDNTKNIVPIRCQYCLQDFRKTHDLRYHLNCAGNCNLLYLLDLKRKENKLSTIKSGKSYNTSLLMTNNQINPPRQIINIDSVLKKSTQGSRCTNDQLSNNSGNLNLPDNQILMFDVGQQKYGKFNTVNHQGLSSSKYTIANNITQLGSNPPSSNVTSTISTNESHCFTDVMDCTNYITPSSDMFDNLIPNNLFFDDQVFDIFRDIDFKSNVHDYSSLDQDQKSTGN